MRSRPAGEMAANEVVEGAGGEGGSGRGRRKRWWPARLDPAGEVLAGKAGGQGGGGRRRAGVPIWIERERKERAMWWGEWGVTG